MEYSCEEARTRLLSMASPTLLVAHIFANAAILAQSAALLVAYYSQMLPFSKLAALLVAYHLQLPLFE